MKVDQVIGRLHMIAAHAGNVDVNFTEYDHRYDQYFVHPVIDVELMDVMPDGVAYEIRPRPMMVQYTREVVIQ